MMKTFFNIFLLFLIITNLGFFFHHLFIGGSMSHALFSALAAACSSWSFLSSNGFIER